jgi:hypothetical protein
MGRSNRELSILRLGEIGDYVPIQQFFWNGWWHTKSNVLEKQSRSPKSIPSERRPFKTLTRQKTSQPTPHTLANDF